MNARTKFDLSKTWAGYVYVKAWWLKGIIDLARAAKAIAPGELVTRTGLLLAMPAAQWTGNENVINTTWSLIDLAALAFDPIGWVANKSIVAVSDFKLDEWWDALSDEQRASSKIQEAFALLHILKLEAARNAQLFTNKLEQRLLEEEAAKQPAAKEDVNAQNSQNTPKKPAANEAVKPQYKEKTDYSRIDSLAGKNAKFYKHTRDKHNHVVNTPCDGNQAKEYIAQGGTIEINLKHAPKTWISSKDLPKAQVQISSPPPPAPKNIPSVKTPASSPQNNPSVKNPAPDANPEVQAHQPPTIVIVNAQVSLQNNADAQRHQHIADTPASLRINNSPEPILPVTEPPVRHVATPIEKLEQRHTELAAVIKYYSAAAKKREHGFFAGQLPRHLFEMNRALNNIQTGACTMHAGIETIKYHAKQMGTQHPVYIAANKYDGALTAINQHQQEARIINTIHI